MLADSTKDCVCSGIAFCRICTEREKEKISSCISNLIYAELTSDHFCTGLSTEDTTCGG